MLVTLKSTVGFKLPEEQEDALNFEKSVGQEWTKVRECATTEFDPNVKKEGYGSRCKL